MKAFCKTTKGSLNFAGTKIKEETGNSRSRKKIYPACTAKHQSH
jgi:hypothetical protein